MAGLYDVKVDINAVNGTGDENPNNNSLTFQTEIYPQIVPPIRLMNFFRENQFLQLSLLQGMN